MRDRAADGAGEADRGALQVGRRPGAAAVAAGLLVTACLLVTARGPLLVAGWPCAPGWPAVQGACPGMCSWTGSAYGLGFCGFWGELMWHLGFLRISVSHGSMRTLSYQLYTRGDL